MYPLKYLLCIYLENTLNLYLLLIPYIHYQTKIMKPERPKKKGNSRMEKKRSSFFNNNTEKNNLSKCIFKKEYKEKHINLFFLLQIEIKQMTIVQHQNLHVVRARLLHRHHHGNPRAARRVYHQDDLSRVSSVAMYLTVAGVMYSLEQNVRNIAAHR